MNELHQIEEMIISKMAKEVRVQPFQMKSMIKRCPDLMDFYKDLRAKVISERAAANGF